jgi:hypothetical protein
MNQLQRIKNPAVVNTDRYGGKVRLSLFASPVKTGGKNEIKKYAFTIDSTVSGGFTPGPGSFVFLDTKQDTGKIFR